MAQAQEKPPQWMLELEDRLNRIKETHHLGHEIGAGANCFKCLDACPGLNLHFWRKRCLNCNCKKEYHNIPIDVNNTIRFEILFGKSKSKNFTNQKRVLHFDDGELQTDKLVDNNNYEDTEASGGMKTQSMEFDWLPPGVSNQLAVDYMKEMPELQLPITGTLGAKFRDFLLEKQIPLYDVSPEVCHRLTPEEQIEFLKHLENIRNFVVGQAKVCRIVLKAQENNGVHYDVVPELEESKVLRENSVEEAQLGLSQEVINFLKNFKNLTLTPYRVPRITEIAPVTKSESHASKDQSAASNLPCIAESNGNEISVCCGSSLDRSTSDLLETRSGSNNTGRDFVSAPMLLNQDTQYYGKHNPHPSSASSSHYSQDSGFDNGNADKKENQTMIVDKPMVCSNCKRSIKHGSVAVVTDRTGSSAAWHPKCFVCNFCQEYLVDLVYFYYEDAVYCERHYVDQMKLLRCFGCDELIFGKEYTVAEGKTYHVRHFCCYVCDTMLGGKNYILEEDHPVCIPCYEDKHCKVCHTCKEFVRMNDHGICVNSLAWHARPSCFKCQCCSKFLLNTKFILKEDEPFCTKACYSMWVNDKML